jgi:hypothetical protein
MYTISINDELGNLMEWEFALNSLQEIDNYLERVNK